MINEVVETYIQTVLVKQRKILQQNQRSHGYND